MVLAEPELCRVTLQAVQPPNTGESDGAEQAALPCDLMLWADGPYSYVDYVFRGVSKVAKLQTPPVGYRDC